MADTTVRSNWEGRTTLIIAVAVILIQAVAG
jgi:hypothetical protein